ncbi:hypothetical protein BGZ97_011508 [Linnemannia gamsii]|uniref:Phytanoyl-CoA hydroxylase-interacting protein-like C-terminal domain-containing protein n=1 Tax=Linnemannia gamsii TaxID=64522 RepID=A0A9P6R4Y4_9FUNG|nr:hypothetical protein BGZ97_011508 [Linnemannia gamsii]
MNPINVVQESMATKLPDLQNFCAEMRDITQARYLQALRHVGVIQDTTHASAATTAAPSSPIPAPPTVTLTPPPTSLPCYKIYRNWHPEDLQREERHLLSINEDLSVFKEKEKKPTTFLLSYPAEKYQGMKRTPGDSELSPIVNTFFNLLGLFFCATATAIPPLPKSSAPVATSPYGTERYQVPFQDLERTLFPEYRLFFADFYKVKEDWYVQLVVVPSWNYKLEEQCLTQGLVELDVERNPFFFRRSIEGALGMGVAGMGGLGVGQVDCRHPNSNGSGGGFRKPLARRPSYPPSSSRRYHHTTNINTTNNNPSTIATTTETRTYEYRVYTHPKGHPKVWTELLIGCDVFPTSEVGEKVQCLLHENVRQTPNTLTVHQERQQLATILEGVALDIEQIAGRLRGGTTDKAEIQMKNVRRMDDDDEEEMKRMLELTYRLSRDRTRLGMLQSNAAARSRIMRPAREDQ